MVYEIVQHDFGAYFFKLVPNSAMQSAGLQLVNSLMTDRTQLEYRVSIVLKVSSITVT